MDNTLTIQLFAWGCAVTVALEAYKANKRAAIVLWGCVGAFAAFGFIFPWLGGAYPKLTKFATELVSEPASWFSLMVGCFFVARPYWVRTALTSAQPQVEGGYDDEPLKTVVGGLAERMLALVKDVEKLDAKVTKFSLETVQLSALPAKLEDVRVDGALATRGLEKLAQQQKEDRERAQLSLKAVGDRERLTLLKEQIREVAVDLSQRLEAGEHYDMNAWNSWLSCHAVWNSRLQEWLETARWFAKGVKETTLTVNDSDYGGEWHVTDSQFHGSEAVRQFKKFHIIHRQWETVIPAVEAGMALVAFGGMTDLEVRGGERPR